MSALVEIRDMSKIYNPGENEVRALDHVSLTIQKGEFVAIIGQSGSGKSTLMNMIGCLDVPTEGTYILNGQDVSRLKDDELSDIRNREIGFIFPISAVVYAYIHKRTLRNTLIDFYSSPAFYMMCCAMIIIFPIAQCIGHGPFVRDVIGDYRVADIKEFFEESCETMGYFLILLSSIEFYLGLLRTKK